MHCDICSSFPLKEMLEFHEANPCLVSILTTDIDGNTNDLSTKIGQYCQNTNNDGTKYNFGYCKKDTETDCK